MQWTCLANLIIFIPVTHTLYFIELFLLIFLSLCYFSQDSIVSMIFFSISYAQTNTIPSLSVSHCSLAASHQRVWTLRCSIAGESEKNTLNSVFTFTFDSDVSKNKDKLRIHSEYGFCCFIEIHRNNRRGHTNSARDDIFKCYCISISFSCSFPFLFIRETHRERKFICLYSYCIVNPDWFMVGIAGSVARSYEASSF